MGKLLTKVAKGVAYGDVSNYSIRNILTVISESIAGDFTEQEMYDTLDYFDWKCPYTGKDLRYLIENDLGGYATDHIYPQNRKWCGLNVKGNLIIVDKKANSKKSDKDVETFLLTDTEVLGNTDEQTRRARLAKIREFQKECGYDPEKIRNVVGPLMENRYREVRAKQEQCIRDTLEALKTVNIHAVVVPSVTEKKTKKRATKALPELVFYPADEMQFKEELMKTKKARFALTYETGVIKKSVWKAESFDASSNLRANIQSRPFWRKKDQEGLVKVEVYID